MALIFHLLVALILLLVVPDKEGPDMGRLVLTSIVTMMIAVTDLVLFEGSALGWIPAALWLPIAWTAVRKRLL